jgi:LPPG:FO 2-phospho-L-lactate transferase
MILALAGGVGGAKLASGLAEVLDEDQLVVAVNTGDDFSHLGLHISPDLDTVMYTLAGHSNRQLGWGIEGETWSFMQALERLGGETWFKLGDQDLATHVERTRRLAAGETLSQVAADLSRRLGVRHAIVPMSDDPVRTYVTTDEGRLAFQEYFVRLQCRPRVRQIEYVGAGDAALSAGLQKTLRSKQLKAVIICPSNPYLSVAPILALPGLRAALETLEVPRIAVSPIIAGRALKGPAAKIMQELGVEVSALEVARYYRGLVDSFVLDAQDADLRGGIEALGQKVLVIDTVMKKPADSAALARAALQFFAR